MQAERAGASFRDPFARLFRGEGDGLVRGLSGPAAQGFIRARDSGWIARASAAGQLVAHAQMPAQPAIDIDASEPQGYELVLTHPQLTPLCYPYEWTFSALQQAALLHLELQISALECGIVFRDASAYNIVFDGARPVFVDFGSFAVYEPGTHWSGLGQFCREFLNPLLVESQLGVPFQPLYRGSPAGLAPEFLSRLLPWHTWLSPRMATLVHLQGRWQAGADARTVDRARDVQRGRKLSQASLRGILEDMQRWVASLRPAQRKSVWRGYAGANSYAPAEAERKAQVVSAFIARRKPRTVTDLGCNTGAYARLALNAGAGHVIGVEGDASALDEAQRIAFEARSRFTAIVSDIGDPSPAGGWLARERLALGERIGGDAVLALALIHHLVLGRNLPLAEVIELLCGIAPTGLLEYIPCDDPMSLALLALRPEPAAIYTEDEFLAQISRHARVLSVTEISSTGRKLVEYEALAP